MSRFLVRRVQMVPVDDVEPEQLISMKEAADILRITIQALAGMMDREGLEVYEDTEAPNPRRGRRFLLRAEVLEKAAMRGGKE